MTGPEPAFRRESGRVLILGSVVLAVLAAAALAVGSDDARLLRLGIVAALWATLLGTFAAVRMRREVSSGAERADELRVIYQLELDREIAARREHELTVERELREQLERRERREITALRGELASLRDTLRNLLGGDVLVERVALRAESTRLLPISEHSRTVTESHSRLPTDSVPRVPPSLPSAEPMVRETTDSGRERWDRVQRPVAFGESDGRSRGADPPYRRQEPVEVAPSMSGPPMSGPPMSGLGAQSEPSIFAQTAAELARNAGVPTNRDTGALANRTWSPAVSSTPSRQSALDQDRSGGPVTRQMSPQQMSQGGRHSRPSAPRYGSTPAPTGPSTGHAANGNGSHAQRPVNELLATYGEGSSSPRSRHGRADD